MQEASWVWWKSRDVCPIPGPCFGFFFFFLMQPTVISDSKFFPGLDGFHPLFLWNNVSLSICMLAIVRRKEPSRVSFIYLCPFCWILMKCSQATDIWLLRKMGSLAPDRGACAGCQSRCRVPLSSKLGLQWGPPTPPGMISLVLLGVPLPYE